MVEEGGRLIRGGVEVGAEQKAGGTRINLKTALNLFLLFARVRICRLYGFIRTLLLWLMASARFIWYITRGKVMWKGWGGGVVEGWEGRCRTD